MISIQPNVFYANLLDNEVGEILEKLNKIINQKTDYLNIYLTQAIQIEHSLGKTVTTSKNLVFFPSGNNL
jgi:CRISPR/Cas system-associated endoribonuclease Cas2